MNKLDNSTTSTLRVQRAKTRNLFAHLARKFRDGSGCLLHLGPSEGFSTKIFVSIFLRPGTVVMRVWWFLVEAIDL